jgi:hypothetical protein
MANFNVLVLYSGVTQWIMWEMRLQVKQKIKAERKNLALNPNVYILQIINEEARVNGTANTRSVSGLTTTWTEPTIL